MDKKQAGSVAVEQAEKKHWGVGHDIENNLACRSVTKILRLIAGEWVASVADW